VLAGFPDDRADEGPAAGPATLLGLEIARENGWSAPRSASSSGTDEQAAAAGVHKGDQAYTGPTEAEATVEDSPAETVGEDAGGKQNPKGGS
jgi:NADH-quinone oxidoreductase subunit E